MKSLFITSVLCFISTVWSAPCDADETIYVELDTEAQLMPLYLGKLSKESSGFDPAYVAQLENILRFDLDHNGMTSVVKESADKEKLLNGSGLDQPGIQKKWQAQHVFYVVQGTLKNKKLSTRLFSVSTNTHKGVDELLLTGKLEDDRRKIHQVADAIHRALFGKEGIASTRLLYAVKKQTGPKKWSSDIWEADYDGFNARQITRDVYSMSPAYVPPAPGYASGSFFYVSYQHGQPKIYYASLKDGIGHRFTLLRGNQLMPAIARQRDQVAFISDATGNPDLFVHVFSPESGPVGKPRQIFAAPLAVQGSPAFSPDGKQIAFVSNKDGVARIYTMPVPPAGARLQDLKPALISKKNRENTAPAWSPDGSKLAYCAMTDGVRQIWIYDFDRREERQLTQGAGNKENPSWAPNSLHLVFNSTGAQGSELYIVNLNQPRAFKITSGPGEKHYPSWEPKASLNE